MAPSNLFDVVAQAAAADPSRLAIRFGDRDISYRSLVEAADRTAGALKARGVEAGDRVAIHARNCPEILTLYLAVARLGAVYVPINPELSAPEIAYILDHALPKLLFGDAVLGATREAAFSQGQHRPSMIDLGVFDAFAKHAPLGDSAPGAGHGLVICYTSGSTGRPKGVYASHAVEIASAAAYAETWDIGPADRVLIGLPLAYIYGLTTAALTTLCAGGTIILLERFNPVRALEAIARERVTTFMGVPTMYGMMIDHAAESGKNYDVASWRLPISAGAALPSTVRDRFRALFGRDINEFYALSEVRPVFAFNVRRGDPLKHGYVGKPAPEVEARLVGDDGRDCATGQEGDLLVRSPTLMLGYYRDPELTAAAIKDGWFHSGDRAVRDEADNFAIVGRTKDIIIRGGAKISPAEVEAALSLHPAIRQAAAFGAPDALYGEQVKAVVALRENCAATIEELQAHCREHLAAFKVPSIIEFRAELPVGPTGKILKKALL
jgi:long-chain acyl-CoA synthetase